MEPEELEDFPNPFTHGVPFDRELVDLAEPEAWRAWVCACAEYERARRQHAEAEQARERRERANRNALRRGSIPVGMPLVDFYAVSTGSPPPFISNPFGPALERAGDEKRDRWQRAEASVRARLGDRSLRAFGRPETIAAPRRWIAPHVAQYLKPAKGNAGPGVAECGNALYVETTVFDSVGVPFDQAAVAYEGEASFRFAPWRSSPMRSLGRLAAARRCARDTARDPREEEALSALRLALADRLRAGTLLAFREGASEPLPAEDFAPGGRLGDVGRWDAEPGILVRPPEPPSRTPFVAVAEPSPAPVQKKGRPGRAPLFDWQAFWEEGERYCEATLKEAPGQKITPGEFNAHMKAWAGENLRVGRERPGKKTLEQKLRELRAELGTKINGGRVAHRGGC
ncbi:hypothetical protein [Acidibrevibacterium fodinaquatile]|uniref:hypothetical protein n=1 Tax=Acidibrevibacterium fodinaquatile TaxID=1969806 RepID=UPI0013B3D672|nr:hypothetical protein [Acidibrevibacterium fodinaquatile]